ncbi:MAG TPA: acyl-CoA dehydrogenase family protein, partial [Dehalococcoidia bacterium]
MDVLLTDEEDLLRRSAREFLEAECPPDLVRAMEADLHGYPPALWSKVAELGWLGLVLPQQYGGDGAPLSYAGLLLEEAGRAALPLPLHCTLLTAFAIAEAGSEAQKRELLPRVARGDLILTWALTERDPRFLPEAIHAEATAEGDGFVITGTKLFVDNVNVAQTCLVVCRTRPGGADGAGISLFLVDTDAPGMSQRLLPTMAAEKQSELRLDGVHVSRTALVGELHQGWPVVEWMLTRGTALLCSQIVGATRKAVDMAVEYAKTRVAFGRPIGAFQAIAHLCADMTIWVDGTELLTREALWRLSEGLPAETHVSTAKAYCNQRCQMALHQANQIHAGVSQIKEFDLQLWYRRATAWTMRLGTT